MDQDLESLLKEGSGQAVFLTQALEKEASLWAPCSALTITLRGPRETGRPDATDSDQNPDDNSRTPLVSPDSKTPTMVHVCTTSRCCSGKGQIEQVLELVKTGDDYELQDKGKPLFTVGYLGGQHCHLWIEGFVLLDAQEFGRQDKDGVFEGDLKAGDSKIEVFGVTDISLRGSPLETGIISVTLATMPFDFIFDINASVNFAIQKQYPAMVMTGVLTTLSLIHSLHRIRKMSSEYGQTLVEFFRANVGKSVYGGALSHDMNMLTVYQFSEDLILHTVVAYGVLDWQNEKYQAKNCEWGISMSVVLFGIVWVAKDMAYCASVWTEHMAHASRYRFNQSRPGEILRLITSSFNQLANPVLTTTIMLSAINYTLPAHHLGLNLASLYQSIFVILSLGSWYFMAIFVPHMCFLGDRYRMSEDSIVDIPMHLVICNVNGEAPCHRKRHAWSPKFHLYKFLVQIMWKVLVAAGLWMVDPEAFSQFRKQNTLTEEHHVLTPQMVIVGSWIVGMVVSVVLEFVMLVVAQCGLAYPGLSFFAEVSRTVYHNARTDAVRPIGEE